jgi:hypothetical protein
MLLTLFTIFALQFLFLTLFVYLLLRAAFISGAYQLMLYVLDSNYPNTLSWAVFITCFTDSLTKKELSFSSIKDKLWVGLVLKLGSHKQNFDSLEFISARKNNTLN